MTGAAFGLIASLVIVAFIIIAVAVSKSGYKEVNKWQRLSIDARNWSKNSDVGAQKLHDQASRRHAMESVRVNRVVRVF